MFLCKREAEGNKWTKCSSTNSDSYCKDTEQGTISRSITPVHHLSGLKLWLGLYKTSQNCFTSSRNMRRWSFGYEFLYVDGVVDGKGLGRRLYVWINASAEWHQLIWNLGWCRWGRRGSSCRWIWTAFIWIGMCSAILPSHYDVSFVRLDRQITAWRRETPEILFCSLFFLFLISLSLFH